MAGPGPHPAWPDKPAPAAEPACLPASGLVPEAAQEETQPSQVAGREYPFPGTPAVEAGRGRAGVTAPARIEKAVRGGRGYLHLRQPWLHVTHRKSSTEVPPLSSSSLRTPHRPREARAGPQGKGQSLDPPFQGASSSLQTHQDPLEAGKQTGLLPDAQPPALAPCPLPAPGLPCRHCSAVLALRGLPGLHRQESSPGGAEVLVSILGGCLCE